MIGGRMRSVTLLPCLVVTFLAGASPTFAQPERDDAPRKVRIDVLTGQPARPQRQGTPSDPIITNAPHAPLQRQKDWSDEFPVDVYVAPDNGAGGVAGVDEATRSGRRPHGWIGR